MAQNNETLFTEIMNGAFMASKGDEIDNGAEQPFRIVPAYPSVETLLTFHDGFLASIFGEEDMSVVHDVANNYLDIVCEALDIASGDAVNMKNIYSFTTEDEPGMYKWTGLPYEVEAYGTFKRLSVGNWFDIPLDATRDPRNCAQYARKLGLLARLDDVCLIRGDGMIKKLPEGPVLIPLSQGRPGLYKVLR